MSDFPIALTSAVDNTTDVLSKHINNLEAKIGINASAVTNSIDYLLKAMPEGTMINGKIVPSVASDNLTVALKGMNGNDPSVTNPIYVRIGNTVRSITSALSVTKDAATNWCNAGSTELATKEIDYFVYIGYNTTDGVVIGFSRIPYSTLYGEFSATTTDEEYAGISTITNATGADVYVNIGRFAATLSAEAGYTWTVPVFTATNLIQKPIYESRRLAWEPTIAWVGTDPTGGAGAAFYYQITNNIVHIKGQKYNMVAGTTNTSVTFTLPFTTWSAGGGGIHAVCGHVGILNAPNLTSSELGYASGNLNLLCTSVSATAFWFQGDYFIR